MLENTIMDYHPKKRTASGLVTLLESETDDIKSEVVSKLLSSIDEHWHEVADSLPIIQNMSEDPQCKNREEASLLASKILYNLEMIDEALWQALNAGPLFIMSDDSPYTQTMIATGVHHYCFERNKQSVMLLNQEHLDESSSNYNISKESQLYVFSCGPYHSEIIPKINPQLDSLIQKLIELSWNSGHNKEYKALGITIEARRLDLFRSILVKSEITFDLLRYSMEKIDTVDIPKYFRTLMLETISEIFTELIPNICENNRFKEEYVWIIRALFKNGNYYGVSKILYELISNSQRSATDKNNETSNLIDEDTDDDSSLLAYQIAFDLLSFENQDFISAVMNYITLQQESVLNNETDTDVICDNLSKNTDKNLPSNPIVENNNINQNVEIKAYSNDSLPNENFLLSDSNMSSMITNQITELQKGTSIDKKKEKLKNILNSTIYLKLTVDFLHGANHTDLHLLDQIKSSVDPRFSITQNAIIICHALLQAGTTCDVFVRENLDWFGKIQCWAKFTASAANGILHQGHIGSSKQVLCSYLPGSGGGSYSEGGALMAMGLIHANHYDEDVEKYLIEQLLVAQSTSPSNYEPLQHGACLGLGLIAMGTSSESKQTEMSSLCHCILKDIRNILQDVIFADSAIPSEAAAFAVGLVFFGNGSIEICEQLLKQAREIEHEKIIRALSIAVACIMYGKEEKADSIILKMIQEKNCMIRYGGMFAIGLAYCGTSSRNAIKKLLHANVTDISDDIRRAAIMSIAFVLCRNPKELTDIMALLADSFNPHVRFSVAMSVGCGCCGTGLQAAVNILLPMTQDTTDFVRSAALLGLSLVLVQSTDSKLPDGQVQKVRDLIIKVATDKDEDSNARFGAIIGLGLLYAGGQNCTISLLSSNNMIRPKSVVGLLFFCQLWYWYPLILMVSLAFRPTALIALNSNLEIISNLQIITSLPSSKIAYTESVIRSKKDSTKKNVASVQLSSTKRRQYKRINKLLNNSKDTSNSNPDTDLKELTSADDKENIDENNQTSTLVDAKMSFESVNPEKTYTTLKNPCRVLNNQESFITIDLPMNEYIPINPSVKTGFIIMKKYR